MAGRIIRKLVKWFFVVLNLLASAVFLIACLAPYINTHQWPAMGFLSLAVPYLAILLFFSILFWLVLKPVIALVPVFTLLIGWKQLSVIMAWHIQRGFTEQKSDTTLRVIQWNVRGLYGISNSSYTQHRNRQEIAALINRQHPDIICMQEFNSTNLANGAKPDNISLFTAATPYYFFSRDYTNKKKTYSSGAILFSKYPIIDSGRIQLPDPNYESIIYVDIVKGNDTMRIFTTHLESYHFTAEDYANMEKIRETDAEMLEASKNLYSKMSLAFARQGEQSNLVRSIMDKSPYPAILCGDFNAVPSSYTYFKVRGNWQDAFLASSFGIGKSYNGLAPTLRIDYILPDNHYIVNQFQMVDEGLSDHHMLVSDVQLKK